MHRIRRIPQLSRLASSQSSSPVSPSVCIPAATFSIDCIARPSFLYASFTSSGSKRHASVLQPPGTQSSKRTTATTPPEISSSLDHIVPKSLFKTSGSSDGSTLPEQLARQVVEIILVQLRSGIDATSQSQVDKLQIEADENVRNTLELSSISASSLHHFITQMLRTSKDPRKTPIAFRLFGIAFGMDPLLLNDPTAKSPNSGLGLDSSLASIPIAGKGAWGINAAGYSWASMVLSGQSPPPPGIHLVKRGSPEYTTALARQQAAAVRMYATLAMRGDPQGMLGMGRVLIAGTQRPMPGKSNLAEAEREIQLMRDRTVALWTKAGQLGVGDAWFELALLYLGPTAGFQSDEAKARQYLELGAKAGSFRCHHALGVLYTQAAMADNTSPSTPQRLDNLSKSLDHFISAADMGDPQSAHNLGLRYLLRDEMVNEIALGQGQDGRTEEQVLEQAKDRHSALWGVKADDIEAIKWFRMAAEYGSVPAMMNYAGMLVEGRGRTLSNEGDDKRHIDEQMMQTRLEDLKKAESLYSKAATHGNVMAQQQQQAASRVQNGGADQAAGPTEANIGKEMASFAQEALEKVQGAIQAIMQQQKSQKQTSQIVRE